MKRLVGRKGLKKYTYIFYIETHNDMGKNNDREIYQDKTYIHTYIHTVTSTAPRSISILAKKSIIRMNGCMIALIHTIFRCFDRA